MRGRKTTQMLEEDDTRIFILRVYMFGGGVVLTDLGSMFMAAAG